MQNEPKEPKTELVIAQDRIIEIEQRLLVKEQELAQMKDIVNEVLKSTVINEALSILSQNKYVAIIQQDRVLLFHIRKVAPALENKGVRVYYHTLIKYNNNRTSMSYTKTEANKEIAARLGPNAADSILNAYNYTILVQDDMEILPISKEGFSELDHEDKLREIWEQVKDHFNNTES